MGHPYCWGVSKWDGPVKPGPTLGVAILVATGLILRFEAPNSTLANVSANPGSHEGAGDASGGGGAFANGGGAGSPAQPDQEPDENSSVNGSSSEGPSDRSGQPDSDTPTEFVS